MRAKWRAGHRLPPRMEQAGVGFVLIARVSFVGAFFRVFEGEMHSIGFRSACIETALFGPFRGLIAHRVPVSRIGERFVAPAQG